MGFQVFPEPTPATDFETLGIAVTAGTLVEGTNVVAPSMGNNTSFVDYAATATVTTGIYLGNYTLTTATSGRINAIVMGNDVVQVADAVTTGVVFSAATTTFTSFSMRMRSAHINSGGLATGGTTRIVTYMFIPNDTRPIIAAGGIADTNIDTGNNYNQVWISTNGSSFTGRNIIATTSGNANRHMRTAWHDGSNFYVVPANNAGSNFIWWSTNGGVNWTTRATANPTLSSNLDNVYGGYYDTTVARHYLYTTDPVTTWTSTNGVNWSGFSSGFTSSAPVGFARAGNFLFTFGAQSNGDTNGSRPKITISTNGLNWAMGTITNIASVTTTNDPIMSVAANTVAGSYVAVTSQGQIFLSTNVVNWNSVRSFLGSNNGNPFNTVGYSTVAFGDGIWIAAGGGANTNTNETIAVSTDGTSWVTAGGTQGASVNVSGGSTFGCYLGGGFFPTGRTAKWLFYAAGNSGSPYQPRTGIVNFRADDVFASNTALGRAMSGIRLALQRFKFTRNAL